MASTAALVIVGYDGSPDADHAIAVGAELLPEVEARIAYLWSVPFASAEVRRRLRREAATVDELIELMIRESRGDAERLADRGVAAARSAGWVAQPLLARDYGAPGLWLAQLAERLRPVAVVVGARGLTGVRAVLGSVSDALVHYSPVPVIVVPHADERLAQPRRAIVVGYDGSAGATRALDTARAMWPRRPLVVASVGCSAVAELASREGEEHLTLESHGPVEPGRAVAAALADCAERSDAALIAVGSRGRSAGREILLGSAAMATLHHAHRPVMAVPPPDRLRP